MVAACIKHTKTIFLSALAMLIALSFNLCPSAFADDETTQSPGLRAATTNPTCISVVSSSNRTISEETSYKTLYIAKGKILTVKKPLKVSGDIYVFGRIDNYSTITVSGSIYCLYNSYSGAKIDGYDYGKLMSCTNSSRVSGSVKVTTSYLTKTIPSASHGQTETIGQYSPTCTESGQSGTTRCKLCGDVIRTGAYLEPLGHNWDDGVVTVKPSLKGPGTLTYTCLRCNEKSTRSISNVDEINEAIQSLGPASIEQVEIVASIRNAYDALSDEDKAAILNYDAFLEVEATVNNLKEHSIAYATIKMPATTYVYSGRQHKPEPVVIAGSTALVLDQDYSLSYSNNVKAGTATVKVTGKGNYTGSKNVTFKIDKSSSTLTVKPVKAVQPVKYGKKTTIKAAKVFKVTKNVSKGKVTYKKVSGNAKIKISSAGRVTVGKGLKKRTYSVKVKVVSASTTNYKASSKIISFKIKVK